MSSFKSICPCCDYVAESKNGVSRSDIVRRHILRKHKIIPWDHVDLFGFKLKNVALNRVIKFNPITKKYAFGFCFSCLTHIPCSMVRVESKEEEIRTHVCRESISRGSKKGDGVKKESPAKTQMMTQDSLWDTLKNNPDLKDLELGDAEEQMRDNYAMDDTGIVEPFIPEAVLVPILLNGYRYQKNKAVAYKKANDMENRLDEQIEENEQLKRQLSEFQDRITVLLDSNKFYRSMQNDPEIVVTEIDPGTLPVDSSECVPIQKKAGADGYCTE